MVEGFNWLDGSIDGIDPSFLDGRGLTSPAVDSDLGLIGCNEVKRLGLGSSIRGNADGQGLRRGLDKDLVDWNSFRGIRFGIADGARSLKNLFICNGNLLGLIVFRDSKRMGELLDPSNW